MSCLTVIWQINISDIISACLQVIAIIVAVYVGYWLSERSRNRQELQREYATIGHPFRVLLLEVHKKASEMQDNYEKLRNAKGAAGLELLSAINTFSQLNSQEHEVEIFRNSIDRLESIVGQRPVGFRAPDWEFSTYTLENLVKFGFRYDSSLMDDEKPYAIKHHGKSTGIVELPVSWLWDDWGIFEEHRRPPSEAFNSWIQEFDALYAAKLPYLSLTMHPQTIGRASRAAMLETLIRAMRKIRGVRFSRCIDLVTETTFEI